MRALKTIEVTQADIEAAGESFRCSAATCPIAQAICRALHMDTDQQVVLVEETRVLVGARAYWLPPAARDFIVQFDDGSTVEPFSFDWDGP